MKLTDIKGERALDVIADILEPIMNIAGDKGIRNAVNNPTKRMDAIKIALKKYKKDVITIMAILEGESYEQYCSHLNVMTLPAKIVEIFNDKDLLALFGLEAPKDLATSSGSASENTQE